MLFAAFFGPRTRMRTSRRALCPPPQICFSCKRLPWEDPPPKFHAKILDQPSRSPSRKGIPGKYREVAKPAGGRGALYVAALEEKEKARRHAQTEPGRAIPWELREEHAEGSRTHYLAGPGTHWINQQKFWRVKNKVGPKPGINLLPVCCYRHCLLRCSSCCFQP